MALTAYPTIAFNSSTGSDTLASGAGPATAITCLVNGAVTNSTTIVVDTASGDLDTIAQDGSAVLFITGIGFVRISTTSNATLTIVVETAVTIGDNVQLAIGGKRATLDNTESRRLFAATASPTAVGASGLWTISLEDDQTVTSTITTSFTAGTDTLIVKSNTPGTLRAITSSANSPTFTWNTTGKLEFQYIHAKNSNGTKTSTSFISLGTTNNTFFRWCRVGDGTNNIRGACVRSGGAPNVYAYESSFKGCTEFGIANSTSIVVTAEGCEITNNGTTTSHHGLTCSSCTLTNCIIAHNAGDGVNCTTSFYIINCTIDQNGGDGIECTGATIGNLNHIRSCIFTTNTGTAIKMSGTTPHYPRVWYCVFNGNGADASGITLDSSNQTSTNPSYTDSSSSVRNYTPTNTALRGDAMPTGAIGQSASTSYLYPGAVQPQGSGSPAVLIGPGPLVRN